MERGQQLPSNTYNNNFRVRLVATAGGASVTGVSAPFTVDLRGSQGGLTVAGKVLDANTRQPVSGAGISLAGQNTTTLADGNYSLANVALNSGNTLTASKTGYASHQETVATPPGATRVMVPDICLRTASGNKPVVTGVQAKYDGLFLSGASIANEYTASVDWRDRRRARFISIGGAAAPNTKLSTRPATQRPCRSIWPLASREFHARDNRLTVQAEDSAGQLSDAFVQKVAIIPMPFFLVEQGALLPFTFIPGNHPNFLGIQFPAGSP